MAGYGLYHWLMLVVAAALVLYPVGPILTRLGFSPLWSIVALVPLLNLIGLWIVALIEWPRRAGGAS